MSEHEYREARETYGAEAFIAKMGAEEVHWVGTSMGGIIGMLMSGIPGSPVKKLVMNDVGSFIPKAALERLGQYVGTTPSFDSLEALTAAVKSVSPFGALTDAQWRQISESAAKQDASGKWVFRYDPGIAETFKGAPFNDVDMRHFWNAIPCPVLVIRGDGSDLLIAAGPRKPIRDTEVVDTLQTICAHHAPMPHVVAS